VHVLPARGAHGVRPGIGGRIDREPQPRPPGARIPDRGALARGHPGQRRLHQPVIDHVALRDPPACHRVIDERRQRRRQQGEQLLVVNPPGGQRVIQRAVAAGELRLQAQPHQRRHRVIGAQHGVGQLEQGVRPPRQAAVQPGPELPQPLQRPVTRDCGREHSRIRGEAIRMRQHEGIPGPRQGLQPRTRPWQGIKHGRFLS
jgi:hypothetical protein